MPFTRPDTMWATIRVRVEERAPGNVVATVLRNKGFDIEARVDRAWDLDGPLELSLRLDRSQQLDPSCSFIVPTTVRPKDQPYVEQLEAQHLDDDRTITIVAWPWLMTIDEPDPRPRVPPCDVDLDVLVLRVA